MCPSDSSTSATNHSPRPARKLPPSAAELAPTAHDGSHPASTSSADASVEVVVFPELYKNASDALSTDSPLLVIGRLEKDEENVKIIAGEITLLENAKDVADKIKARNTHILARSEGLSADKLESL